MTTSKKADCNLGIEAREKRITRDEAPTSPSAGTFHYVCPCPRGLEAVLADELRALGAHDIDTRPGGHGQK